MGTAVDWQQQVIDHLKDVKINIFNPRRKDWDFSWEQSINNPKFVEQVMWELDALEKADTIIFFFDIKAKSPITLLELGLQLGMCYSRHPTKELIVCCPEGFWRKGNVDIVTKVYNFGNVKCVPTMEKLLEVFSKRYPKF